MPIEGIPKKYVIGAVAALFLVSIAGFIWQLKPVDAHVTAATMFSVQPGDGFTKIAKDLATAGLIRSRFAFEFLLLADGTASSLQPGIYKLSPAMSASAIAHLLAAGNGAVTVTIPEGFNVYQIDAALSDALVIRHGDLISYAKNHNIEGFLFPDTYQFTSGENASSVVETFLDNFDHKALPMFASFDATKEMKTLTIASIIEKEVVSETDRRIVAGILEKRLAAKMPLDVDATVCYAKQVKDPTTIVDCASLMQADFKNDSPYNTYRYRGLPPSPIGNPGTSSIAAVLSAKSSPYWFYLSDPATGKTIYAATLAQQEANQAKYLK